MPRIQCLIKAHSMLQLCCVADQVVFQNVDCLSLVYCCYLFLAHVMPTRFRASRGKQCSFSFVVTFSFWCNFLASVQLFLSRVILFCAYSDIKVERKINTEKEKKKCARLLCSPKNHSLDVFIVAFISSVFCFLFHFSCDEKFFV